MCRKQTKIKIGLLIFISPSFRFVETSLFYIEISWTGGFGSDEFHARKNARSEHFNFIKFIGFRAASSHNMNIEVKKNSFIRRMFA